MFDVSQRRIHLLRGMYLYIALGLTIFTFIPPLLNPETPSPAGLLLRCLMIGTALLALLGLRYPIKMIPLLLFELFWKSIWLLAVGLPLVFAGSLDEGTISNLIACLMGVILVPLTLPWRYVIHHYWKTPGEPWKAPLKAHDQVISST